MAKAMSKGLSINATWERLELGSAEERASFALIGICGHDQWLTEAEDAFARTVRREVHLSAYLLAQWLSWNWWRLRFEPRRKSLDWAMAHRMTTIGGGYVWPNITITSDGQRVVLIAAPTLPRPEEPLRYLSSAICVLQAVEFDNAIDDFVRHVLARLIANGLRDTNLENIWNDLIEERASADAALYRKLEALLGKDPGEGDERVIKRIIEDSQKLGEKAAEELAASGIIQLDGPAKAILDIVQAAGVAADFKDAVRLDPARRQALPSISDPAWKRGGAAARALQEQERLSTPISDADLCRLAGVPKRTLTCNRTAPISFALEQKDTKGSVVLKYRSQTGRRFALARLIGDRITHIGHDRLFPATDAATYRQKMQRAFAAELLCPINELLDKLGGDLSDDVIEEAAHYFQVSPLSVRTILVAHRLLEQDALDAEDPFVAAA